MTSQFSTALLCAPALLGASGVLFILIHRDLAFRRLPNTWVGAYAALFVPYATACGMGWAQLNAHLMAGFIALLIAAPLFAFRAIGGGDVKLWGAVMLWVGPQGAMMALVVAALCGAVLGVLGLVSHFVLHYRRRPPATSLFRMLTAARGVPYGVALAIAGLHSLWATGLWLLIEPGVA
jgi:prepilin peptidase CpaA